MTSSIIEPVKLTATKPAIAFLGTGLMGAPMALRLLDAGYGVTVWNRSAHKSAALVAHGAVNAATPAAAVADAAIVITMLEAGPVVAQVLTAALPALAAATLVIDMSSTAQDEALTAAALLAAHGVAFMDAPVSGGVIGAQQGSLAIMAGASAADFERALALLQVLGRPLLVGPVGSGQLAKLCNQLIVGATVAIVAEALLLAQAGGADPGAVRAALRGGFAESRILEVHGARMLARDFMPGGQIKSQAKDMANVMRAAQACGVTLPQSELMTTFYAALAQTVPHADQAAALLGLEQQNPGVRLGTAPDHLPVENGPGA